MSYDDLEGKIELMPTAIPWYETEEDYLTVTGMLGLSEDDSLMSYRNWVAALERHEEELQSRGAITRRIPVDPITLKAWCNRNNLSVSRPAITEFIMLKHGGSL